MSFWTNFRKDIDKAKKIAGAKIQTTKKHFGEGLSYAKEMKQDFFPQGQTWGNFKTGVNELGNMIKTPMQNLQKTLTPDKTQDSIQQAGQFTLGHGQPQIPESSGVKDPNLLPALKTKSGEVIRPAGYLQPKEPSLLEKLASTDTSKFGIGTPSTSPKQLPEDITQHQIPTGQPQMPVTSSKVSSEYDLLSPEGQKQVAEAEAKTGLKGADAIRALRGETTTPLQDGMDKLGWHPPMALPDEQIEQSSTYQKSVKEQTIGVTDPARAETIKTEIKRKQQQIATYQMLLDRMPGVTPSDKDAYNDLMNTWAEGGASAEDIAQIIDNLTRADEDMISNQIMPVYKKHLETPAITKAKQTMEDLYKKYSNGENDLNNLFAEKEKAINAIKQSSYLTHNMMVGRISDMNDRYNMEINLKQNQLNSIGKDIDRGRSALKDMTTEGMRMAEIEIGSLELGVQEDILGKTGLGWESMAKILKDEKAGETPETVGAGRFQYDDKSWKQVTPFAPTAPSSKADKQTVTSEHDYNLQGLIGEGKFVPLDAFIEMAQLWMSQTGDYNPDHYFSRFGTKYLSEDDYSQYNYKMSGVGQ